MPRPVRVTGSETPSRILPPMPLSPDFYRITPSVSQPNDPLTVIACDTVWVVSLFQRVDDESWIVSLDRHRNGPGGPTRPAHAPATSRGALAWNCGSPGMRHGSERMWQPSTVGGKPCAPIGWPSWISRRRSGGSSRRHIGSHVLLQLPDADT